MSNNGWADPDKYLEELDKNFPQGSTAHETFLYAKARFNDVKVFLPAIGAPKVCSPAINPIADQIEILTDGKLYIAIPSYVSEGITIHCDPPLYVIGFDTPQGFGIEPYHEGIESLRTEVHEDLLDVVESFLARRRPVKW